MHHSMNSTLDLAPPALQIFKRVGWAAGRLLLVPGIVEAFFDGGLAIAFFGMPPAFGIALGFILKAVGPALVIQAMFEVQQKRLGVEKSVLPFSLLIWDSILCNSPVAQQGTLLLRHPQLFRCLPRHFPCLHCYCLAALRDLHIFISTTNCIGNCSLGRCPSCNVYVITSLV